MYNWKGEMQLLKLVVEHISPPEYFLSKIWDMGLTWDEYLRKVSNSRIVADTVYVAQLLTSLFGVNFNLIAENGYQKANFSTTDTNEEL